MTRSRITTLLVTAIALQVVVLSGMLVKAVMPLWTGTELKVRTVPIDPRSMFRGNYALLNYEFSSLPDDALGDTTSLRVGEVVYVTLGQGDDGLYRYERSSLDRPEEGVFLRGRLVNIHTPYRVKFGIEAFFAPKKKALQLEKDLRGGGVAILMVTDNGRVALSDVIADSPRE